MGNAEFIRSFEHNQNLTGVLTELSAEVTKHFQRNDTEQGPPPCQTQCSSPGHTQSKLDLSTLALLFSTIADITEA